MRKYILILGVLLGFSSLVYASNATHFHRWAIGGSVGYSFSSLIKANNIDFYKNKFLAYAGGEPDCVNGICLYFYEYGQNDRNYGTVLPRIYFSYALNKKYFIHAQMLYVQYQSLTQVYKEEHNSQYNKPFSHHSIGTRYIPIKSYGIGTNIGIGRQWNNLKGIIGIGLMYNTVEKVYRNMSAYGQPLITKGHIYYNPYLYFGINYTVYQWKSIAFNLGIDDIIAYVPDDLINTVKKESVIYNTLGFSLGFEWLF